MTLTAKHRWMALSISIAVLILVSWRLIDLQLWGHWCLPWFLVCWTLIVFLTSWKSLSIPHNRKLLGLSTLSGLLLFLGFPTMPFTPLLFISFIPLLIVLDSIHKDDHKNKGRRVLFYSYHTFILWNILSTYWVANTAFAAGIVAIGLNSFFMAAVFWVFYKIHNRFSENFRYWVLAAFWISFEYLHMHWEISWPWLTLGNAFSQYHQWIQWYEYTGVFGGTLWIWILNILGLSIYKNWKTWEQKKKIINTIPLLVVLCIPILISYIQYVQHEEEGSSLTVASVQPNFEPHYEKFTIPANQQKDRFIQLSEACVNEDTDILLFPETSFGYFDIDQLSKYPVVNDLVQFLQKHDHVQLITGISSYRTYSEEDIPEGRDLRKFEGQDGRTLYLETQNSAILLNPDATYDHYLKSIFVPGAEIFPYKRFLPFLTPLVKKLGGSMSDWGSQKERSVFKTDKVFVAPVICYESIFGQYVGNYIKKGAQAIMIVTNDGWWDNTMGFKQHALFSRLRAIEHRKPVVRSANLGWSCFINQRGDIRKQNEYGVMGCVQDTIMVNNKMTVYTIWGDLIARVAIFTTLLSLLSALMYRFRKK